MPIFCESILPWRNIKETLSAKFIKCECDPFPSGGKGGGGGYDTITWFIHYRYFHKPMYDMQLATYIPQLQ